MSINNIAIIGKGNLCWHFNKAMQKAGCKVTIIDSRKTFLAEDLSNKDVILLAVSDRAIETMVQKIYSFYSGKIDSKTIILHTSGCTSSKVLSKVANNYGVLYPIYSLKKDVEVDFSALTLAITANNSNTLDSINVLANRLSYKVITITDKQREVLHVGAVFANNFTNHLLYLSKTILSREDLPFELLYPIIEQTFTNCAQNDPFLLQTGPAIREDTNTMLQHLSLINKEEQRIYQTLSADIIKTYHKNKKN